MAKEVWIPPPDPNFEAKASGAFRAWQMDAPDTIAFDTETTGLTFADTAFCVTMAWRGKDGSLQSAYFELVKANFGKIVAHILNNTKTFIGHNLKFDLQKVIQAGLLDRSYLDDCVLHDTEALAHLDDEHRLKGLKGLATTVLGYDDIIEVEVKSGPRKGQINKVAREKYELDMVRRKLKIKKDDGYHLLPRATLLPYAIKDAEWTLQLYEKLMPKITKFDDLYGLYKQEMELSLVLLDMEYRGMAVRLDYVNEKIKEYNNRVLQHELDIEAITGMEVGKAKTHFNPNSPAQVLAFFHAQNQDLEATDEEHLAALDHPLAKKLVEYRSDMKILNTYFRAIKKGTRDGVFHPSIRQHGTVTGRTSSGGNKGDS